VGADEPVIAPDQFVDRPDGQEADGEGDNDHGQKIDKRWREAGVNMGSQPRSGVCKPVDRYRDDEQQKDERQAEPPHYSPAVALGGSTELGDGEHVDPPADPQPGSTRPLSLVHASENRR
jgi:hypothetical protein